MTALIAWDLSEKPYKVRGTVPGYPVLVSASNPLPSATWDLDIWVGQGERRHCIELGKVRGLEVMQAQAELAVERVVIAMIDSG